MRRIIFILGGCVLLSLLGITPFQAMAVKDSTKNMDAYWIYKIQSHEKILASHNEYVPDRMVYDVQRARSIGPVEDWAAVRRGRGEGATARDRGIRAVR